LVTKREICGSRKALGKIKDRLESMSVLRLARLARIRLCDYCRRERTAGTVQVQYGYCTVPVTVT
jgi:hypothetical protein